MRYIPTNWLRVGLLLATGAGSGLAASAPTVVPSAIEAERLSVAPTSGVVVRERGRSGGRVLVVTGAGGARATLRTAKSAWLTLSVRAAGCRDLPRISVAVGRTVVISTVLGRTSWRDISSTKPVRAGTHRITVRLANQVSGRCRRAIRVDRIWFAAVPVAAPGGSAAPGVSAIWHPPVRTTWQWQLSGPIDQTVDADMYDVDAVETPGSVVASLHAKGRKAVCYLSAGSYEKGRPDAGDFPTLVLGNVLDGWPDERWLDIRRLDLVGPIMARRMDVCRRKGFDGVEADNVDGYANGSGFGLTAADQLAYNRYLADAAHARGLSIGLKNDIDQVAALEPAFDWAINEQCFQYNECAALRPFLAAGKPVFVAEYDLATSAFCSAANVMGVMAMRKRLALDAFREPCW
jgi:hypothetical protein